MIKNSIPEHRMGVHVSVPIEDIRQNMDFGNIIQPRWSLTIPHNGVQYKYLVKTDGPSVVTVGNIDLGVPRLEWQPLKLTIVRYDDYDTTNTITYTSGTITLGDSPLDVIRNWMMNYEKKNIWLEKVTHDGLSHEMYDIRGSFITEMNHEVIMDREMSEMEITINFDHLQYIL